MRASIIACALTFAVALHPCLAQENAQPDDLQNPPSRITFVIHGDLRAPDGSESPLPLSIIEKLEQQPALAELHLKGPDALPYEASGQYEVKFIFGGMQAFRQWYDNDQTRVLLQELKERSGRSMLDFALQVQRPPFGRASNE